MEFLFKTINFVGVFILFMSILFIIREIFRLVKSIYFEVDYEKNKVNTIILGCAIAYILTLITI